MAKRTKTKKEGNNKKPIYKKVTGGFLKLPGWNRRIKPNEEVEITLEELGGYAGQFKLVKSPGGATPPPTQEKTQKTKTEKTDTTSTEEGPFKPKLAGGGKFNVVSASGKVMNEQPLTAEKADELVQQLNGETDD